MSEKTWKKEDLIHNVGSKKYNNLLKELENNIKFIEGYRNKLKPNISVQDFMKIIKTKEKISEISSRLGCYAFLWFSEDTSDQKAKSFMSSIEQLLVSNGNRTMFFSLWFKSLDDKNAKRIINGVPKEFKYYLESIRKLKKYTLNESEEKIINIKDTTGTDAVHKLYEMITNDFTFNLRIKNKKGLTRDQLTTYVKDPNPEVRRAAYQELYKIYSKYSDVLNEIYRNRVLDWKNENINLRKFKSSIAVRNVSNDISDKAIQTLLNVCKKNRKVFQDYFKLKAKICKIKNITRYDIYTHYSTKSKKYSYKLSIKLVFKAYKEYSEEMYKLAKKIVDDNHIDYEQRKGKKSGGFCMDAGPGIVPYILLNHGWDVRDVFTIAHELGHGVHDLLTHKHSILTCHAPLILAETASIFGEMLLFDSLIKGTRNKETKKTLLLNKLDDTYATIIRQIYFVLFEIKAHEMIAKGADLNDLNKAYLENLREQFGNSVKVPDEFKYEWLSIPHIYDRPFYCYSYTFGNLLVLALYEKYKKEGKSFIPKYLKILSYGGSENPSKVLKGICIDIESEKFWQSGFDLVKGMVKELRDLA